MDFHNILEVVNKDVGMNSHVQEGRGPLLGPVRLCAKHDRRVRPLPGRQGHALTLCGASRDLRSARAAGGEEVPFPGRPIHGHRDLSPHPFGTDGMFPDHLAVRVKGIPSGMGDLLACVSREDDDLADRGGLARIASAPVLASAGM